MGNVIIADANCLQCGRHHGAVLGEVQGDRIRWGTLVLPNGQSRKLFPGEKMSCPHPTRPGQVVYDNFRCPDSELMLVREALLQT